MQKYNVGDRVICVGSENTDVYAHYLKGSIGTIIEYHEGADTYELEFETTVDSYPEYRDLNGHDFDYLVDCARFKADELELFEGEDSKKPDPGFNLVFDSE